MGRKAAARATCSQPPRILRLGRRTDWDARAGRVTSGACGVVRAGSCARRVRQVVLPHNRERARPGSCVGAWDRRPSLDASPWASGRNVLGREVAHETAGPARDRTAGRKAQAGTSPILRVARRLTAGGRAAAVPRRCQNQRGVRPRRWEAGIQTRPAPALRYEERRAPDGSARGDCCRTARTADEHREAPNPPPETHTRPSQLAGTTIDSFEKSAPIPVRTSGLDRQKHRVPEVRLDGLRTLPPGEPGRSDTAPPRPGERVPETVADEASTVTPHDFTRLRAR